MHRYDCSDPVQRSQGVLAARGALRRAELVVFPTETVYGLAADAFSPDGVTRLREVQERARDVPVPVLIGRPGTVDGLVLTLGADGRRLVEAFWPGPLTVIARAHPSLQWNLGDGGATVSVRMPLHPLALELLRDTGPLAVTSAARAGMPAARSAAEAMEQFGDDVTVYLDGGELPAGDPSSVIDVSGGTARVLREGAFSIDVLREVAPELLGPDDSVG